MADYKKMWHKLYEFAKKNPKKFILGSLAATYGGVTAAADSMHSTYDIVSQHSQEKVMKEQAATLKRIEESLRSNKKIEKSPVRIRFRKKEKRYY